MSLSPLSPSRWDFAAAAHLLNRAGFGGRPAEIEALERGGLEPAIRQLFTFTTAPESAPPPSWAKPDPDRALKFKALKAASEDRRRELRRELQRENRRRMLELQQWWLQRMANTGSPLQEKLVLFWHGHFATSIQKVRDAYLMWRQNELFRQHASGDWPSLLDSITADPAMLLYLDQAESKPEHPNENYARELLELFSLGEGHYTEHDVTEAARALTGLSYDRLKQEPIHRFRLRDPKPKTLFGQTGNYDEKDLVRRITQQPASAVFISNKLWTFFAGTEPAPELGDALAAEFRRQQQRIGPFLEVVFRSEAFYAPNVRRQQIKSPVQLLVGACRQLERELPPAPVAFNSLRLLGQELFNPPNVKGWDGGIAWINTSTLLTRHNLALLLTTGENPLPPSARNQAVSRRPRLSRLQRQPAGAAPVDRLFTMADLASPEALVRAVERRLLQARLGPKDRQTLLEYVQAHGQLTAHELQGLLRLAMCTPDYQLT